MSFERLACELVPDRGYTRLSYSCRQRLPSFHLGDATTRRSDFPGISLPIFCYTAQKLYILIIAPAWRLAKLFLESNITNLKAQMYSSYQTFSRDLGTLAKFPKRKTPIVSLSQASGNCPLAALQNEPMIREEVFYLLILADSKSRQIFDVSRLDH